MLKYDDTQVVDKLMSGTIWRGQTAEQVVDALGSPLSVDTKVLKTKSKEIWKYDHRGANRYALRVTIENGIVVGWDQKEYR